MLGFVRALFSSSASKLFADVLDVLVQELQQDPNIVRLLEIAGGSIGEWPIVKKSVEKRLYKELIDKVGRFFLKSPDPDFKNWDPRFFKTHSHHLTSCTSPHRSSTSRAKWHRQ